MCWTLAELAERVKLWQIHCKPQGKGDNRHCQVWWLAAQHALTDSSCKYKEAAKELCLVTGGQQETKHNMVYANFKLITNAVTPWLPTSMRRAALCREQAFFCRSKTPDLAVNGAVDCMNIKIIY